MRQAEPVQGAEIERQLSERLPFWDKLDAADAELLLTGTRPVSYRRGESIYSPSNECVGLLLIKSGELRCYILSESGKEVTLFRLDAGESCILSASCLLASITFDVFIDAEQDSELLLLSPTAIAALQERNVYVENYALRLAAERFSDVMWAMEQILFMSLDTRLAVFLLDEAARTGEDRLTLTHEQIARYIGSAREVVSRMLKYFENEGLVRLHRGGAELIDKPALRELAQTKSR